MEWEFLVPNRGGAGRTGKVHSRERGRAKGVLVVLLALVPLAAGCGSDPSAFEGSDDALKDASSSRIEWKIEGEDIPVLGLLRATGAIDYANSRGEMDITGKSGSGPKAHGLFIGHDSYLGVKVGGTTYWLKQSVDDAAGADRFMPGPGGVSPESLLQDLIKSSKKVEKLGGEEIRGVPTTRYRAHLEKTELEDEPGVVDAWIDEQGLPRRIRVPYWGEDAPVAVVDLFDFGVQVDVDAPPADEIVSEEKMDELMERECASADKAPQDLNPMCLLFGATLESGESTPAEPMPRRVTDYK
jgi:hypothetical protein